MPYVILLVDDNAVQAATRRAILSGTGNQIEVATNPIDALKMLDEPELANRVRLVITDHLMPNMKGPQFVAELRKRFPVVPVLVLSGLPGSEEEYAGMKVVHRLKPLAPESLIQLAQSLCSNALGRTA